MARTPKGHIFLISSPSSLSLMKFCRFRPLSSTRNEEDEIKNHPIGHLPFPAKQIAKDVVWIHANDYGLNTEVKERIIRTLSHFQYSKNVFENLIIVSNHPVVHKVVESFFVAKQIKSNKLHLYTFKQTKGGKHVLVEIDKRKGETIVPKYILDDVLVLNKMFNKPKDKK